MSREDAARLEALTELVADHTAALQERVDRLGASLERLGQQPEPVTTAPAPARSPGVDTGAQAARLVALEMALAGRSRGEARQRIAGTLEAESAATILDDVFGAGGDDDARLPWAKP